MLVIVSPIMPPLDTTSTILLLQQTTITSVLLDILTLALDGGFENGV